MLVVEDNTATRTLIEQTFELEGYEVACVADGVSALDRVRSEPPSLVILDAMIPKMDGFSVLREIRANEDTREVPVLMLTAMDDADSTWKGWSTGCDYYMNKPFDPDELLGAASRLCKGLSA